MMPVAGRVLRRHLVELRIHGAVHGMDLVELLLPRLLLRLLLLRLPLLLL